jgi:hypothetical protein
MMDILKKFHGATLDCLVFQWEARVLEFTLRPVGTGPSIIFRLREVSKFLVPSEALSGNSVPVSSIKCGAYGERS